jgi:hypothetical protein
MLTRKWALNKTSGYCWLVLGGKPSDFKPHRTQFYSGVGLPVIDKLTLLMA